MKNVVLSKPVRGNVVIKITEDVEQFGFNFYLDEIIVEKHDDQLHLYFEDLGNSIILDDFYAIYHEEFMPRFIIEAKIVEGEDFFAALDPELMPALGYVLEYNPSRHASILDQLANGVNSLNGVDGESGYEVDGILSDSEGSEQNNSSDSRSVIVSSAGGSYNPSTQIPSVDDSENIAPSPEGGSSQPAPLPNISTTTTPDVSDNTDNTPSPELPPLVTTPPTTPDIPTTPPTTPDIPTTPPTTPDIPTTPEVPATPTISVEITQDKNNDGVITQDEAVPKALIETKISIEDAAIGDDIVIKQGDKIIFEGKVTEDILKDGITVRVEQPNDNSNIEISATITASDGKEYESSDTASILRPPTVEIVTDGNNDEFISSDELNDDKGKIYIKVTLDESSQPRDIFTVEIKDDEGNTIKKMPITLTKEYIDEGSFVVSYTPTSPTDIGSIEVTATIERNGNSASGSDSAKLDDPNVYEFFESNLENGSSSATGKVELPEYSFVNSPLSEFTLPTITSNGVEVSWSFSNGTLTGTAGDTTVIEIKFTNSGFTSYTGEYEIVLSAPIDHPEGSDLKELDFVIPFKKTGGGTEVKLTIEITDDKPTINNTELNVSEKDLALNPEEGDIPLLADNDYINQLFKPSADETTMKWDENILENLNEKGLTTEDGQKITWIVLEGSIYGTTLSKEEFYASLGADETTALYSLVMQIYLSDEDTGEVGVSLFKPIKHNSDIENLELSYTVTDKDGDSVEGKVTINIEDYVKVSPPKVEIVDDVNNNSYLSDEELNDSNPDDVTIKITLDKDSTKPGDKLEITDQNNVTVTHTVTQEDIDNGGIEITRPNPGVGEKIEITVTQTGADGSNKGTGSDQAYYDKPDYPKINEGDINNDGEGYTPSATGKLELESTPNEDGIVWDLENMPDLSVSTLPSDSGMLVNPEITWSVDEETGNLIGSVIIGDDGYRETTAIEISISKNEDGSFSYEVTLKLPIEHDGIHGANIERLEFPFTYKGNDGNSYTGSANVDIVDDTPTATGDEVTLSEEDLIENPISSFFGDIDSVRLENFNFESSIDGSSFAWDTDSIPTLKTEDGKEISWDEVEGILIGHTLSEEEFASAAMNEDFATILKSAVITVMPSEEGQHTINLHKPIKHDSNTESFDIKFNVTDKDGDIVQESIKVNITNYAPPKVEILEDVNNDSLLTDSELDDSNPDNVTIKVTVDELSSKLGDKLIISVDGVEQETITVTQDIIDNGYTTTYKNPEPGKNISVSVKQESASGDNKGTGKDSAVVDSATLPELKESDIGSEPAATVTGKIDETISLDSKDVRDDGAFELDVNSLPDIFTHDGQKVTWEQSDAWQSDGVFTYRGYVIGDYGDSKTVIEINIATNDEGIVDGSYEVKLYEGIEHDSIQGSNSFILTIPYSYKEDGVTHSGTTIVKIVDDTPTSAELITTDSDGMPASYFEIDFGSDGYGYTLESMNGDYREVIKLDWDLDTLNSENTTYEGQSITWSQDGNTLIAKIGDEVVANIWGEYEYGRLSFTKQSTIELDIDLPFTVYDGDGDKLDLSINMNEVTLPMVPNSLHSDFASIPVNPVSNVIFGTDEDNMLYGTDGDDILIGGLGSDTLEGGEGEDTFTWKLEDFAYGDVDTIVDFDIDSDRLDLTELKADGYNFKVVESTSSDPEADYDILISKTDEFAPENTHKITLNDVSEGSTSADDIMKLIETDTNNLS